MEAVQDKAAAALEAHVRAASADASLSAQLFAPSSEGYKESLGSYFSAQQNKLRPAYIARPRSAADIARVVKLVAAAYATNPKEALFAVRSGGNTAWAGSSNITGGLTIDLRHFDQIVLSDDRKSVTIGTGCTWGDVYEFLDPLNLTIAGGRASQVGVGGLSLGGGLSFLSPRHGFVCDNILQYEVIVASGEILHVTHDSHPDLFKALKGGSNNFGIVTTFTFKTFEQGKLWGGSKYYPFESAPAHLDAFHGFVGAKDFDPDASLMTSFGYAQGNAAISEMMQYLRPEENPACFGAFNDIPSFMGTQRVASLFDLTSENSGKNTAGIGQGFWTTTFVNDREMLQHGVDTWHATVDAVKDIRDMVWAVVYQPIPSIITAQNPGTNVLGLEDAPPLVLVLVLGIWNDATKDELIYEQAANIIGSIDARAKDKGVHHPFKYLNYAWRDQDVMAGYGVQNRAFLEQVSAKYDPEGLFQYGAPGGFKLFS